MKTCIGCKSRLPLSAFGIHKRDGHQSRCISCKKTYQKEWHQKNKPRRLLQIKTYQKRITKETVERVNKLKEFPCMDCGRNFPAIAMDFDHREGEVKVDDISVLVCRKRASFETILQEIAKCDLVCACCHRVRTYNRRMPL